MNSQLHRNGKFGSRCRLPVIIIIVYINKTKEKFLLEKDLILNLFIKTTLFQRITIFMYDPSPLIKRKQKVSYCNLLRIFPNL